MSDLYTLHGILDILKWTVIDTAVIAIPFGIYLWRYAKRERETDEFIKKHYRL